MRIIGIDPGRHLGIALLHDGAIRTATYDLGDGPIAVRLATLYRRLQSIRPPDLVVYEEPAQMRGAAGQHIAQYLGVIRLWCELRQVPSYPVNQATLKAWVRQRTERTGKMDKRAMLEAARAEGAEVEDDNAADAYWLARYGMKKVITKMQ